MKAMTIDSDMVDWSNIQTAIDALKQIDSSTDLGITKLIHDIKNNNEELHDLFFDGFPDQEIVFRDNPVGIPITLAKIVTDILQYCATTNIDLVSAMQQWMKEGK